MYEERMRLEDDFVLKILFHAEDVLDFLELEKKDIVAFYRQEARFKESWDYCRDLYLTKNNIIVVEFKGEESKKASIKVIPLSNYKLQYADLNISVTRPSHLEPLKLELEDIKLGDELESIVKKPIKKEDQVSFDINYLHFKDKLMKLILGK